MVLSQFYTKSFKKAFTLPEVIVAMGVLVMVIIGSTNLLVSIVRSNTDNVNTIIAYQLAQEGLDGIRNIRDSDWLLNANFQGFIKTNTGTHAIWGDDLPAVGQTEYYLLDYHHLANENRVIDPPVGAAGIQEYAPWKLTHLSADPESIPDVSTLFIHKSLQLDGTTEIRYVHDKASDDVRSIFSRYLKIQALGYDLNGDNSKVYKYRVTAVVLWDENHRSKNLKLTTELTDWKGGPL